jgi:hypothetical protein
MIFGCEDRLELLDVRVLVAQIAEHVPASAHGFWLFIATSTLSYLTTNVEIGGVSWFFGQGFDEILKRAHVQIRTAFVVASTGTLRIAEKLVACAAVHLSG